MAPPPPHLPTDCLLHVFVHLDPVSTVRCAAVSRHWRRAVIENAPELRRHPRHLLLGIFHREMYSGEIGFSRRSSWLPSAGRHWSDTLPVPSLPPPAADGTTNTRLYAPLACSDDGLLLLCRGLVSEISVCNPLTGFHASIPRPTQLLPRRYVLHSCTHGAETANPSRPNSFQVLALQIDSDGMVSLQNYCSESGAWGPAFSPNAEILRMPCRYHEYLAAPVVCRGAVHWLCSDVSDCSCSLCKDSSFQKMSHVVAVELGATQASSSRMIRLPTQCVMHNRDVSTGKMLMLATSEGDRLSLLRAGEATMKVSIWLYAEAGGDHGGGGDQGETNWVPWQSVDVRKLMEDAGLARYRLDCKDWSELETRLEWFSPKTRSLIIWIPYIGLFVLDLKTMQIRRAAGDSHGHIWPYEIDLTLWHSSIKPL